MHVVNVIVGKNNLLHPFPHKTMAQKDERPTIIFQDKQMQGRIFWFLVTESLMYMHVVRWTRQSVALSLDITLYIVLENQESW
jgi:hypothetical protein